MLFRQLFSTATGKIAISRIVPPTSRPTPKFKNTNNNNSSKSKVKYTYNNSNFRTRTRTDDYAVCMKAKAIARSSGAETALSFALNRRNDVNNDNAIKSPVLLNTVLSALSREGKSERFWQFFTSKSSEDLKWTPELIATLLNQLAIEGNKEHFDKAVGIYCEALDRISDPHHCHIHNAFLKCVGRFNGSTSFLLWLLGKLNTHGGMIHVDRVEAERFGIKEFLPTTDASLKLSVCLDQCIKKSVALDSHTISSIFGIISRSEDGSIAIAESIWSKLPLNLLDAPAHLALLIVYRNDLARILHQRKLIRSTGWRERKISRVEEIISNSGVDLTKNPKYLSVYYEICVNANLREKVRQHVNLFKIVSHGDPRLEAIIQKAMGSEVKGRNKNKSNEKILQ